MGSFNFLINRLFDGIFYLFISLNPWVAMVVVCLLTGIFMLLIFRYTSNQKGIRQAKDKIKAHFLELRLFKEDFSLMMRAQGKILRYNLIYMKHSLKPMLIMILPLVIVLIQFNFRFGFRPFKANEEVIVGITFSEPLPLQAMDISLEAPEGLEVETPPLRINSLHEVDWRLLAKEAGNYILKVHVGEELFTKMVTVSDELCQLSPRRVSRSFFQEFLYPSEPPLPSNSPVCYIEVKYPTRHLNLGGWNIHWLIVFFVLSIAIGFALKGMFKVEI
ncbi:hypothetical protein CEE39_07685 [bacterium (candidate division B38) B3_B38]|nr:MAG: hypothetical protein CEE39_07685 [bacterium (candidate division B38) B3_B38]